MKQDITEKKQGVDFTSYDSIVIKKHITDIEGGRTLDMTDYPEDVLFAAHVIISQVVNSEKVYKPMPVVPISGYVYTEVADPSGSNPQSEGWFVKDGSVYVATTDTTPQENTTYYSRSGSEYTYDDDGRKKYSYGSLPAGATYEGVLYRSLLKAKPAASILIDGVVNDEVMKIKLGAIESAFMAAMTAAGKQITFNHDEEA